MPIYQMNSTDFTFNYSGIILVCDSRPAVNGAVSTPTDKTLFLAGESLTYSCTNSLFETSSPTVTCQASGTWSSFSDCTQTGK